MKANILLIEDDDALAMGLEFLFKQEGMNVTRACDCKSARAAFSGASYDLIVLDITLPDGNGFDLCRDFRASSDTPILFLTALDDELSQVRALDGGGDDYVTKPFALKVLVSRVNALLRRGARSGGEGRDELANMRMDAGQMKCYVDGRDVGLTATEWKLLWALRQNAGQTLTRTLLLEKLWDAGGAFIDDNTLSVHVRHLREKLMNAGAQVSIATVRGVGYRLEAGIV